MRMIVLDPGMAMLAVVVVYVLLINIGPATPAMVATVFDWPADLAGR